MATKNIGGDSHDQHYRYKMPPIQTKIEGRGNGIKTVITNMQDIALSLKRNAAYPTKYFGTELGTQSKFDPATGAAVINGAHDQAALQQQLQGFITKFVLCAGCGKPETDMFVKKDMLHFDCRACGKQSQADAAEKLVKFIVTTEKELAPKKSKSDKTEKKKEKEAEPAATSAEGKKKVAKKKAASADNSDDDDAGEWSVDTSAEAVEARRLEMLGMSGDPSASLKLYFETHTLAEFAAEAAKRQSSATAVFDILFETATIAKTIDKHAPVMARFAQKPEQQNLVLLGVERLGLEDRLVPPVLQKLYNADALSDDAVTAFFQARPATNKFRLQARPFLDWLAAAEESDESD
eukprot:TRINITY_DN2908_c0_g1_i1.p2 TRINITY_DN2908_c0_g1~~TRINITY_DN2908_c0_g1_i1.p2  ORF type:complete len:368 (+),score=129.00 TRINITY_DN2908_c0_g1_i1:54-1106(+)